MKAYVVLALGLGLFTPFEALGQAKEIVRVLSLLVQDAGQASRLAQALSANQTAAAWLLARAGRPGGPLVPLDRAEADRLLSILESGSDPALYARMDSLLRPKSPKERLLSGEGLPSSVMVRIQEAAARAAGSHPSIEIHPVGDLLADQVLLIEQTQGHVKLRTGALLMGGAPTSELAVSMLERASAGRKVVIDGPIDADLAAKLYAAGVRAFHSFPDFVRRAGRESRPVRLIFVASEKLLPGQRAGLTTRALAKAQTIPGSAVVQSRAELAEAVAAAGKELAEPVVIFHNDAARGILFEKPMSLEELAGLGVKGLSCNTYAAAGLAYRTTGVLDFEAVVDALANVTSKSASGVQSEAFLESFSSEYNRILEGRSLRERVLFGGVLVAAASPPIAGGILVKLLSKDDEEPR